MAEGEGMQGRAPAAHTLVPMAGLLFPPRVPSAPALPLSLVFLPNCSPYCWPLRKARAGFHCGEKPRCSLPRARRRPRAL